MGARGKEKEQIVNLTHLTTKGEREVAYQKEWRGKKGGSGGKGREKDQFPYYFVGTGNTWDWTKWGGRAMAKD